MCILPRRWCSIANFRLIEMLWMDRPATGRRQKKCVCIHVMHFDELHIFECVAKRRRNRKKCLYSSSSYAEPHAMCVCVVLDFSSRSEPIVCSSHTQPWVKREQISGVSTDMTSTAVTANEDWKKNISCAVSFVHTRSFRRNFYLLPISFRASQSCTYFVLSDHKHWTHLLVIEIRSVDSRNW